MLSYPPTLPYFTPLPSLCLATSVENQPVNLGVPEWLATVEAELEAALATGTPIRSIVQGRSRAFDSLLVALFKRYQLDQSELALFAVGGYGRGELHPHSDVDILLLHPSVIDSALQQKIAAFSAKLWDIGIDPALSVRTVIECEVACREDITIATSLLEARLLTGNEALGSEPRHIVKQAWSQKDFYDAKMREAKDRYLKYNATEYNLEPDIKNAPGGLRDIQVVGWVSKRYFRVTDLYGLVQQEFITEKEYDELQAAEDFLWLIRHHLHKLTGRNENRLLFDYQRTIAERLGYRLQEGEHPNGAVERFMRDYYRFAMMNSTLSEMLTQHYYELLIEARLPEGERPEHAAINQYFKRVGNRIAVVHNRVFVQHPEAVLLMFLLMGQLGIKGIRTKTLRLLKIAARGINAAMRADPVHKQLFLDNLKEQNLLFQRLRTMKRYGVLGQYLPAFAQVTGLMQYDLFHRYTVDAHTLLLVRILHRFMDDNPKKDYQEKFPLVSSIYRRIDRKEILVLAAIFHDIAKGQGGDHSELGELEAIEFCVSHGMSQADANLVGWLVHHHLVMSLTAQKKDISDPDVVAEFAEKVGNVTYLNHLYVLTVADMNATNPQLWNSWRATLLKQLYTQTRRVLRADIDAPTNRTDMIVSNKAQAIALLQKDSPVSEAAYQEIEQLWHLLGDEYFLREVPDDIIWQTKAILAHHEVSEPLVILREHRELALDAVQVFVYTQDKSNLFAVTMSVFDRMDLDVLDARIITATQDFAVDSYVLLDRHGTLLNDSRRQAELITQLKDAFKDPNMPVLSHKRPRRELKYFDVPTKVSFEFNPKTQQHILSLETLDQVGLLARVGQVFLQQQIEVHYARISTLGERAEDMFYISEQNGQALSAERLENLKQALLKIYD